MPVPNLLFIDTNIWLDFYRARNETSLHLLDHVEGVASRLIVTYQLEIEFKKNRQAAMLEGIQQLKPPTPFSRPGIFSNAKDAQVIARNLKDTETRVRKMRRRMTRALENPADHDPVYKVCQRVFHKNDDLALRRDSKLKKTIRTKALRRFLHGCPPRKNSDTSMGDALNWEWMVHCAVEKKAGLVVVSRDPDYGLTLEQTSYINDHLRQEFSDRVSRKRDLLLFPLLSEALKLFEIKISAKEEEAEKELVSNVASQTAVSSSTDANFQKWIGHLRDAFNETVILADHPSSSKGIGADLFSALATQIPKNPKPNP